MVATVADPVASRISTAMSHASTMTEKWAPSAQRASRVPMPVSTSTCLKPPPAATIRMIPATGGSPDSMHRVISLRCMPAPRPRVNMPTTTAMSSAINGVPRVSNTCRSGLDFSSTKMSTTALPSISTTGSRTLASVMANEGLRRVSSTPSANRSASKVSGASTTTHRPASLPNSGPAKMMVGIATRTPRASVTPRSALSRPIAVSGPGCGGTNPCIAESPARAGIPTVIRDSCERRATR